MSARPVENARDNTLLALRCTQFSVTYGGVMDGHSPINETSMKDISSLDHPLPPSSTAALLCLITTFRS